MKAILTFLLIIFNVVGIAQDTSQILKTIDTLNFYLEKYSPLLPMGDDSYNINDLGISSEHISEYKKDIHLSSDSVDTYTAIEFVQDRIIHYTHLLLQMKGVSIRLLATKLNGKMGVTISEDYQLANLSIDEKTGGTYRSRISWMCFQKGTTLHHWEDDGDGVSEIKVIQADSGTKYLLFQYTRGCSYCFAEELSLVHIQDTTLETDFSYFIDSRSWDQAIEYDEEKKLVKVYYETDDLTTDCYCNEAADETEKEESSDVQKTCKCLFRFNGNTFELVEAKSTIIEQKK